MRRAGTAVKFLPRGILSVPKIRHSEHFTVQSEKYFKSTCWFEGRVAGVAFASKTVQVAEGLRGRRTVRHNLKRDGRVHLYARARKRKSMAFVERSGGVESYTSVKPNAGPAAGARTLRGLPSDPLIANFRGFSISG